MMTYRLNSYQKINSALIIKIMLIIILFVLPSFSYMNFLASNKFSSPNKISSLKSPKDFSITNNTPLKSFSEEKFLNQFQNFEEVEVQNSSQQNSLQSKLNELINTIKPTQINSLGAITQPIQVNTNSGFVSAAYYNGWPGAGTSGNPYIIQNYVFTVSIGSSIIYIQNTNVFFIIKNCTFTMTSSGGSGIVLSNVTNGQIINNTILSTKYYGINLINSKNNVIKSNTITNNPNSGIFLSNSSNNALTANKVSINPIGVGLYALSTNNTLINNTINNNTNIGFMIAGSQKNSLNNNTANFNGVGIQLSSSNNNTVNHNYALNNTNYGILLSSSGNASIINNVIGSKGLILSCSSLSFCIQTQVTGNTVNNLPLAFVQNINNSAISTPRGEIILVNSSFITIKNQVIKNIYNSIQIMYSKNCSFINNTLSSNQNGFFMYYSNSNSFFNNTANNNYIAFSISFSNMNSFTNNIANNNHQVAFFITGNNNTIINNTARNNLNLGFQVQLSNNTVINNLAVNNSIGIFLSSGSSNLIFNNSINNNRASGFVVQLWSNSSFISNRITYNSIYGIQVYSGISDSFELNEIGFNGNYGVYIQSGSFQISNNTFLKNNNNSIQAFSNDVTSNFSSNFWYDHLSPDLDHNGIVDSYYLIDGTAASKDIFPMITSYHEIIPSEPTDVQILIGNQKGGLKWNTPITDGKSPIIQYNIYRSYSLFTGYVLVMTTTSLEFQDLNLTNGITYYYIIGVVNAIGQSNSSVFLLNPNQIELNIISPIAKNYQQVDSLMYSYLGINFMTIYIDNVANSSTIINGSSILTSLGDGYHNLTILVTNGFGDSIRQEVNFSTDKTPPIIIINNPIPIAYAIKSITFTYSISDMNTYSISIYIDGKVNQTVIDSHSIINFVDGTHNITIYAIDSVNNWVIKSIIFEIDTTPPEITIINPSATDYSTNSIMVEYNITGSFSEILIYVDGNLVNLIVNNATNSNGKLAINGMTNGMHNITIIAVDHVGNFDKKEVLITISATTSNFITTVTQTLFTDSSMSTTNTHSSPGFTIVPIFILFVLLVSKRNLKKR